MYKKKPKGPHQAPLSHPLKYVMKQTKIQHTPTKREMIDEGKEIILIIELIIYNLYNKILIYIIWNEVTLN